MSKQNLIDMIRNTVPNEIAEKFCSVQPMDSDIIRDVMNSGLSEEELIAQRYEPVSSLGLMWVKK